jgi:hypothetical protein
MASNRLSLYIITLKTRFKSLEKATAIVFLSMVAQHSYAQSITLSDVLNATIEKTNKAHSQRFSADKKYYSWLAASPTLAISHLSSDLNSGTDENEVKVNLAIKSSLQRTIDQQLKTSSQASQTLLQSNQKLLFSGVIREQVWQIKLAQYQVENLTKKITFLSRLEQQYQQLFKSSATNQYPLLLIKKEKLTSEIAQLEQSEYVNPNS